MHQGHSVSDQHSNILELGDLDQLCPHSDFLGHDINDSQNGGYLDRAKVFSHTAITVRNYS